MITTTNYKPEKISIGGLQNKKSRTGNRYQNIPILYDERKAIVHLCGRFMVIPDYVVAPPGKRAIEEVAIMGDNLIKFWLLCTVFKNQQLQTRRTAQDGSFCLTRSK